MSLLQCACLNHLHPYATEAEVRRQSNVADTGNDDFRDLYLADFIEANKRVARHRLECLTLKNTRLNSLGGVQSSFDQEECPDVTMEVAIGYASAVGVSCMDEVASLNEKFRELPGKVETMDVAMTDIDGQLMDLAERQVMYEEESLKIVNQLEERVKELEFSLQQEKARVQGLVNSRHDQLRMINSFRNMITRMEG
jgi:chromosome segregation ATPase